MCLGSSGLTADQKVPFAFFNFVSLFGVMRDHVKNSVQI